MRVLIFLIGFSVSGCINTLLEVKKKHISRCESLCRRHKEVKGAGIDWWSGEKTCVCNNGVRIRLEDIYETNDSDDGY